MIRSCGFHSVMRFLAAGCAVGLLAEPGSAQVAPRSIPGATLKASDPLVKPDPAKAALAKATLAKEGSQPAPRGGGNDECTTAVVLTGSPVSSPYNHAANTTGTSGQGNALCLFFGSANVNNDEWFLWTANATGTATVETCGGSGDTKIAVYNGAACPPGAPLACNDDFCGLQSQLSAPVVAGNQYLVQVGTFPGGANGIGNVIITGPAGPPPANDNCGMATVVVDGTTPFNATGATTDGTQTCGFNNGNDVWFIYTAGCSGTATVTTCSATRTYDTVMSVYDGITCVGPLLGCNDDGPPACTLPSIFSGSTVTFPVVAGNKYMIQVGVYNSAPAGVSELTISCSLVSSVCSAFNPVTDCQNPSFVDGYNCTNFLLAEDITSHVPLTSVCVNGIYFGNMPVPDAWVLTFLEDNGGRPDVSQVLDTFTQGVDMIVTGPAPNGQVLAGRDVYQWNLVLSRPVVAPVIRCIWMQMQNLATGDSVFIQTADTNGDRQTAQDIDLNGSYGPADVQPNDVAICINGGFRANGACGPCPYQFGTCCPNGTAATPVVYAYQVDGTSDSVPTTLPWTISFGCPGSCITMSGSVGLPPQTCSSLVADLIASDINQHADAMMFPNRIINAHTRVGSLTAGCPTCPADYLTIDVFGDATCNSCPMNFCVGSVSCCMPANPSCIPTPPASLAFIVVPSVCSDCDGNGVDDTIDVVNGLLTDLNGNGLFDQCEGGGYVVPSPLGFPITSVPGTVLSMGQGNRVIFNASSTIERGVSVSAPGFESFDFQFTASLAGAVPFTSDVLVRGVGQVGATPGVTRGEVRIRVNNPASPSFGVFATYAAINATDLRVSLLDALGNVLDSSTIPNDFTVELASFEFELPEVEVDAVIHSPNPCATERGAVLRFANPVTAVIIGGLPMTDVREIHIVAVGSALLSMGDLNHATLTARQLASVAVTEMGVGQFNGTLVVPGPQTAITNTGGMGNDAIAMPVTMGAASEYDFTIKTPCRKIVEILFNNSTNPALCGFWQAFVCLKVPHTGGPPTEEVVDPLDFYGASASTDPLYSGGVDIFIPLCPMPLACPTDPPPDPSCPMPITSCPNCLKVPCTMYRTGTRTSNGINWSSYTRLVGDNITHANGYQQIGSSARWPVKLREDVSGLHSCITITFDAGSGNTLDYNLGYSGSDNCHSSTGPSVGLAQLLEIEFTGQECLLPGTGVVAVKFKASGTASFKTANVTLPPFPTIGRSDFNHDSVTNAQDFFDFLTAFFSMSPSAEFNCDGMINSQDFFDFLACFFTLC